MTGLEKIIAEIKHDADNMVLSIKSKNEAECEKILSEAKAEADALYKSGEEKAFKKYDDIIERANSTAKLEERKIMLNARQWVISSMVSSTLNSIKALPDDKYFELIYKMISRYSEKADGTIFFNSADLQRLPENFDKKSSEVSKGKLTVSKTPADIDGGFVLTYGGVDVNCSFSALFSDNSEKISDAVAKLLFS